MRSTEVHDNQDSGNSTRRRCPVTWRHVKRVETHRRAHLVGAGGEVRVFYQGVQVPDEVVQFRLQDRPALGLGQVEFGDTEPSHPSSRRTAIRPSGVDGT